MIPEGGVETTSKRYQYLCVVFQIGTVTASHYHGQKNAVAGYRTP